MLDDAAVASVFERLLAAHPEENERARRSAQIGIKIKETAFKSLVSCVLSAQSRDANTAKAAASLFAEVGTPEGLLALPEARVAELIKACGLYRAKARNLKRLAAGLLERFGGEVPRTRAELMSLPGVGRKSADIMLRFVYGEPAVAVDTHVFRVSRRLGLALGRVEAQVAKELEARIPERFKLGAHVWLLNHGKRVCRSRRPRCEACPLADLCERNGVVATAGVGAAAAADGGGTAEGG